MGKIKGWKKLDGQNIWSHVDGSPLSSAGLVAIDSEIRGYYVVYDVRAGSNEWNRRISQYFTSEVKAKEWAVQYMRNHPRG